MKCSTCKQEIGKHDVFMVNKSHTENYCWECYKMSQSDDAIPFEPVRPKVIAVDLDNTLTTSTSWTEEEMRNATPNQDMVDWVNAQHEMNFIVIHTARRHGLYDVTVEWLEKNNVRYHAIRMEKLPADLYVDDLAVRPEEL